MHFEVFQKRTERADNINSISTPACYPCYELVHNDNWNDFGYYNWFSLWYLTSPNEHEYLGDLKIMTTEEQSSFDALGTSFDEPLNNTFCSLGIGTSYYSRVQRLTPSGEAEVLLKYLRDCVNDPQIFEEFQANSEFQTSIIRDQESKEAIDSGLRFIKGLSEDQAYGFTYHFRESYGDYNEVDLKVPFRFRCVDFLRTMGIIGENGIGKTQLLSNLVTAFISEDREGLIGETIFKNCIVLSSTPLDAYPEVSGNEHISYSKYSLEQNDNKTCESLDKAIRSILSRRPIGGEPVVGNYCDCLVEALGRITETIIEIRENPDIAIGIEYIYHEDELLRVVPILSSGQLHLFSLITYLFCQAHISSLFIIDEPEVHLHPHTMVQFMKVLAHVLQLYNSYAIIATHSPLIIREMVQKNVQVMERIDGDMLSLAPVAFNTFGEDVTTLYHNIFGYNERDSFVYHVAKRMLRNKSYEQVVSFLQTEMTLSLNMRMMIRDIAEGMHHA